MSWEIRKNLHLDINANYGAVLLTSGTDSSLRNPPPDAVAGDIMPVRIHFWERGENGSLIAADPGADTSLVLSGRPNNVPPATDLLFQASTFVEIGTGIWEGELNLNTAEMTAHLDAAPAGAKTITAELEVRDATGELRRLSLQFPLTARPQAYDNQDAPTALPGPEAWLAASPTFLAEAAARIAGDLPLPIIDVATNAAKLALSGIAVGQRVRITGEADRIEEYLGDIIPLSESSVVDFPLTGTAGGRNSYLSSGASDISWTGTQWLQTNIGIGEERFSLSDTLYPWDAVDWQFTDNEPDFSPGPVPEGDWPKRVVNEARSWSIVAEEGKKISTVAEKTTLSDADNLALSDSAGAGLLKRISWSALKNNLLAWFNTITTITGPRTLSGQLQLTSQAATDSNSAMTQRLTDDRAIHLMAGIYHWSRIVTDYSPAHVAGGSVLTATDVMIFSSGATAGGVGLLYSDGNDFRCWGRVSSERTQVDWTRRTVHHITLASDAFGGADTIARIYLGLPYNLSTNRDLLSTDRAIGVKIINGLVHIQVANGSGVTTTSTGVTLSAWINHGITVDSKGDGSWIATVNGVLTAGSGAPSSESSSGKSALVMSITNGTTASNRRFFITNQSSLQF